MQILMNISDRIAASDYRSNHVVMIGINGLGKYFKLVRSCYSLSIIVLLRIA